MQQLHTFFGGTMLRDGQLDQWTFYVNMFWYINMGSPITKTAKSGSQ